MTAVDPAGSPPRDRRASRITLALVISAFVAPIVIAWLLVSGVGGWTPAKSAAQGELLTPPVESADLLRQGEAAKTRLLLPFGQFTLLLITPGACSEECRKLSEQQRQIWLALGRETTRVRVAMAYGEPLNTSIVPAAPGGVPYQYLESPKSALEDLLRRVKPESRLSHALVIADSRGRLVAYYDPVRTTPAGILADLRRLLRAANS